MTTRGSGPFHVEHDMLNLARKIEEMVDDLPEASFGRRTEAREGTFVVRFNADRASALALAAKLKKGTKKRSQGAPKKRTPAPKAFKCIGGPYHGQEIFLQQDQPLTVVFSAKGEKGAYRREWYGKELQVIWENAE